jgi:SAM-dependent methyltransferase
MGAERPVVWWLRRWVGWMRWAWRQRGVRGAFELLMERLSRPRRRVRMHPFDRAHGVETSGVIDGGALAVGQPHAEFATFYQAVPPSRMRAVLMRWRKTPGVLPVEAYAFVDVGCGKGRALLLASELPWREVIGIELDAGLAGVAEGNLARWIAAGRARAPLRVVCGDAAKAVLPEGPLVVYLFNPFQAPVLRVFLQRLQERGVALEVLYLHPRQEWVFVEFPAFERLWREEIRLAPEDVGVDVASRVLVCAAYRLRLRD